MFAKKIKFVSVVLCSFACWGAALCSAPNGEEELLRRSDSRRGFLSLFDGGRDETFLVEHPEIIEKICSPRRSQRWSDSVSPADATQLNRMLRVVLSHPNPSVRSFALEVADRARAAWDIETRAILLQMYQLHLPAMRGGNSRNRVKFIFLLRSDTATVEQLLRVDPTDVSSPANVQASLLLTYYFDCYDHPRNLAHLPPAYVARVGGWLLRRELSQGGTTLEELTRGERYQLHSPAVFASLANLLADPQIGIGAREIIVKRSAESSFIRWRLKVAPRDQALLRWLDEPGFLPWPVQTADLPKPLEEEAGTSTQRTSVEAHFDRFRQLVGAETQRSARLKGLLASKLQDIGRAVVGLEAGSDWTAAELAQTLVLLKERTSLRADIVSALTKRQASPAVCAELQLTEFFCAWLEDGISLRDRSWFWPIVAKQSPSDLPGVLLLLQGNENNTAAAPVRAALGRVNFRDWLPEDRSLLRENLQRRIDAAETGSAALPQLASRTIRTLLTRLDLGHQPRSGCPERLIEDLAAETQEGPFDK